MDLCIKTIELPSEAHRTQSVSILVLMDLCIKTDAEKYDISLSEMVSILVLMDLCIKTLSSASAWYLATSFNPCFNGSMYKNEKITEEAINDLDVSILVLMDLCIKTRFACGTITGYDRFQSLF